MTTKSKTKDYKQIDWEKQARHLFNIYAVELNFDKEDWRVFLARMNEIIDSEKQKVVKKAYKEGYIQGKLDQLENLRLLKSTKALNE